MYLPHLTSDNLKDIMLDMESIAGSLAKELDDKIIELCKKMSIDPVMVLTLATDGVSSCHALFNLLRKRFPNIVRGRCLVHLLALLVARMAKCDLFFDPLFAIKAVRAIHNHSPKRQHEFQALCESMGIEGSSCPPALVLSRWYYLHHAVNHLLKYWDCHCIFIKKLISDSTRKNGSFDFEFKDEADNAILKGGPKGNENTSHFSSEYII
eukprot:TRINITY_DN4257_c0_g2_i1.p1 TRINITY_DN4257_c0_g2~~TRINITY_DN4257_c0_g2_i1.p1  ORF type:complete len:210 (+),score=31.60 TRINITY_DN4257_c0_g2_i1:76-705(+)